MRPIDADKLIEDIRNSNVPWKGVMHRILLQAERVFPLDDTMVVRWNKKDYPINKVIFDENLGGWVFIVGKPPKRKPKFFKKMSWKF